MLDILIVEDNKEIGILRIREFVAGEACDNDYFVEEIAGKLYRICISGIQLTVLNRGGV